MKYNIFIPQQKIVKSGLKISLQEAALLEYIMHWQNFSSATTEKLIYEGEEYMWFHYETMQANMPLLKIKSKTTITASLDHLKKLGLIKRQTVPIGAIRKTYVRTTDLASNLWSGGRQEATDTESVTAVSKSVTGTVSKSVINTTIHNTINTKSSKEELNSNITTLFTHYKEQFLSKISNSPPIFNWGQCVKLCKPHMTALGIDRMTALMDAYLESDDQFYKDQAYSLTCFLSAKMLHQLNQKL